MADTREKVLELENLNVKFVLEDETVEAASAFSLKKARPWAWWERPELERQRQLFPSCA